MRTLPTQAIFEKEDFKELQQEIQNYEDIEKDRDRLQDIVELINKHPNIEIRIDKKNPTTLDLHRDHVGNNVILDFR